MNNTLQIPANEPERIKALNRYQILDSPPDGSFDHLTQLAALLFNVPIAIVSLVDQDRIWFKSHYGVEAKEIGRVPGLCASAILSDELYVVENAGEDPRTLSNPLVAGTLGLRFYAAAPLQTSDGHNLGTFCIIDRKQRYLNNSQKEILKRLARIVMDEMEIRLAARNLLADTSRHLQETVSEIRSIETAKQTEGLRKIAANSEKLIAALESELQLSNAALL